MLTKPSDDHGPVAEINVTPLVDVMLVLLIVFLVTAPLLKPESLGINLAKTESTQSPFTQNQSQMKLSIDQGGHLFIDDRPVDDQALRSALKDKRQDPDFLVSVFVDENLKYARVAEVMALVRSEGIARLSFVVLTKN